MLKTSLERGTLVRFRMRDTDPDMFPWPLRQQDGDIFRVGDTAIEPFDGDIAHGYYDLHLGGQIYTAISGYNLDIVPTTPRVRVADILVMV